MRGSKSARLQPMTCKVMARTTPRGDRRCIAWKGASRCLLDALCHAYRPCCEATCGRAVAVESDSIVAVHGDTPDPFSRGFLCPQAYGVKELYDDLDRLRHPARRRGAVSTGVLKERTSENGASVESAVYAGYPR